MEAMLTARQVAERLHLAPSTVYDLARLGLIGCHRLGAKGGKLLFPESAVAAYWAKTAEVPATREPEAEIKMASRHFRLPPPSPSRRRS